MLEKSEPLDSLSILEYAKVGLSDQNITLEKSKPLDSLSILEYAKVD